MYIYIYFPFLLFLVNVFLVCPHPVDFAGLLSPFFPFCVVYVYVYVFRMAGVSALATWRVAELKRRLVYLKIFADAETIALTPRFGGQVLADHQALGTLDTDMTYEARAVAVS